MRLPDAPSTSCWGGGVSQRGEGESAPIRPQWPLACREAGPAPRGDLQGRHVQVLSPAPGERPAGRESCSCSCSLRRRRSLLGDVRTAAPSHGCSRASYKMKESSGRASCSGMRSSIKLQDAGLICCGRVNAKRIRVPIAYSSVCRDRWRRVA